MSMGRPRVLWHGLGALIAMVSVVQGLLHSQREVALI
jgi:hypothetical protein